MHATIAATAPIGVPPMPPVEVPPDITPIEDPPRPTVPLPDIPGEIEPADDPPSPLRDPPKQPGSA